MSANKVIYHRRFHLSLPRIILIISILSVLSLLPLSMHSALAVGSGPALAVNATSAQHSISPYIYGINFASESFAREIGLPVRRWGGNATTRYNWQNGYTNHASDWYFENGTLTNPITNIDETHTQWIAQNLRTHTQSLLTIPMIGFVAKDAASCGFSVAKYGAQSATDYWRPDCGTGVKPDYTTNITGNSPSDTSQVVDQNFMKSWVQSLISQYGPASSGGVRFYNLDNEPDLWASTHRDVHPAPQTYDELVSKMELYAAAIKSVDAGAQILGPVSYGWTGYWYSELDTLTAASNGYTYFPDYQTHNNQYQVPYILAQLKNYEQAHGTRLLDYLDLHYYPASGVSLVPAGDANMQALRLRSTRSLWDPTYIDESWIGGSDQPADWRAIRMLPRMHAWVDTYYPGTKLAISEYNFGGLESLNGALTQADVLGIFGREGLDLATLWNTDAATPLENQPAGYAFRMFLNYNGASAKFGDTSVSATSGDPATLSIFAARRSTDSALTIMVINKTSQALNTSLALSNFKTSGNAQVYSYSSANLSAIVRQPDLAATPAGFTTSYPANSITLIVLSASTLPVQNRCHFLPWPNPRPYNPGCAWIMWVRRPACKC